MTNPVIPGFHPDPSICFDGEAYYVANSSFEYRPGVPIHRSTDLVSWSLVGNALDRPSQLPASSGGASTGIYAPTLRYHGGRYWLVTTHFPEVRLGHLIVSADRAEGPWSEPVHVAGTFGIDPDLSWDEDEVCHLTWASFHPDLQGIASVPIDPETGAMLGEPRLLWGGTGMASPEGPHLYRIDGWWYLMLAEGGTERGHTETIARSRTLEGPFEPAPTNPILTHRSTTHPVQNTGHADLIQTRDGGWAMVHLGVRPRGFTPGFHVNGRETFLVGIDWHDGWPVVDENRFDVPDRDRSFEDVFPVPELDPRWVAPGAAPSTYVTWEGPGHVAIPAASEGPTRALLTRAVDEHWTAEATLDASRGAGRLEVRIDERHRYGLTVADGSVEASIHIGPAVASTGAVGVDTTSPVTVRIRARASTTPGLLMIPAEPDVIDLILVDEAGEHVLGSGDGRYLSTEVTGGFTGRMVGVVAVDGHVVVHAFRYTTDASDADVDLIAEALRHALANEGD
jgi:hypothetical protein